MIERCPLCGEMERTPVYETKVSVRTVISRTSPVAAFVPFQLASCTRCGHLHNRAFDPTLADEMYGDVPLTNVPVHPGMMDRLRGLLDWLGEDNLTGDVVEIGAGSGHLARLLAVRAKSVRLFEPNHNLTLAMLPEKTITLVSAAFPCDLEEKTVDLVLCRQVLEHVADPFSLLTGIRMVLRPGGRAYVEVPDARYIARYGAFMDLHGQHVQYYHPDGLAALAARVGLRRVKTLSIKNGHDLGMLFTTADPLPEAVFRWELDAEKLARRLGERVEEANAAIADLPGPLALYGATAQGQAFVNACPPGDRSVVVFDDNSALAEFSLFNPSSRFTIREPYFDGAIRAVIILAYLHDTAIGEKLRRGLGYRVPILTSSPEGTTDPSLTSLFPSTAG